MKADAKAKPMTPAQAAAAAVAELTTEAAKAEREKIERFVEDIAAKYSISDLKGLTLVVKAAKNIYRRSPLPESDATKLRNAIPKVTKVLFRDDNAARIASLLMDSDWSRIIGGPYDPVENGKIIERIWEARATFAAIDRMLQQPPRKNANIKLHGVEAVLRRFANENKIKSSRKFIECEHGNGQATGQEVVTVPARSARVNEKPTLEDWSEDNTAAEDEDTSDVENAA